MRQRRARAAPAPARGADPDLEGAQLMRARRAVVVVALCLAPALAPGAWAGEPADQLFASMDQVLKIVDDPAFKQPQERRQAFHRTAEEMFNFEEIARRSLGRHWEARTPAEREEFEIGRASCRERG